MNRRDTVLVSVRVTAQLWTRAVGRRPHAVEARTARDIRLVLKRAGFTAKVTAESFGWGGSRS